MIAAKSMQHQARSHFSMNALNLDDFIVSTGGIFGLGVGLAMVNRLMPHWDQDTLVVRGSNSRPCNVNEDATTSDAALPPE